MKHTHTQNNWAVCCNQMRDRNWFHPFQWASEKQLATLTLQRTRFYSAISPLTPSLSLCLCRKREILNTRLLSDPLYSLLGFLFLFFFSRMDLLTCTKRLGLFTPPTNDSIVRCKQLENEKKKKKNLEHLNSWAKKRKDSPLNSGFFFFPVAWSKDTQLIFTNYLKNCGLRGVMKCSRLSQLCQFSFFVCVCVWRGEGAVKRDFKKKKN